MAASASSVVESTATRFAGQQLMLGRQFQDKREHRLVNFQRQAGVNATTGWNGQGVRSSTGKPRNSANERLSLQRQAMPRCDGMPSK